MRKIKMTAGRIVLLTGCGLVLLMLIGFGVTLWEQEKTMRSKQSDIHQLEAQLEEMRLTAAAMEADLEFSRTDAYIERLAREELGYVKEGEIKFIAAEETNE